MKPTGPAEHRSRHGPVAGGLADGVEDDITGEDGQAALVGVGQAEAVPVEDDVVDQHGAQPAVEPPAADQHGEFGTCGVEPGEP